MTGAKTRVLALLHLPPPAHGLSLKNQRMLDGRIPDAVELRVIRYRFARTLEELGRTTPRKLLLAATYLLRQLLECLFRRPDVGYLTASVTRGGLLRDAAHIQLFRLFRVPCILHVPSMGLPTEVDGLSGLRERMVRSALRRLAAVVALNRMHADELARVVDPERITIVRNGLPDLPGPGRTAAPRNDQAGHRVLFLSNMVPEKGPWDLLEALPRIAVAVPEVEATFAGGWVREGDRQRFLDRAAELGIVDRVRVTGSVDEAGKLRLLDECDVLVFPSYYPTECSPNVVIEAMRHGLPIVATRHAGIPELVEDGRSGLLVEPRDVNALAAATVRVLSDRGMAERLGREARGDYEARHRQERWEREVLGVIGGISRLKL